jgi:hypothetical protein
MNDIKEELMKVSVISSTDGWVKENVLRGIVSKHTHCPNGHLRIPVNTFLNRTGHKECLICKRIRNKMRHEGIKSMKEFNKKYSYNRNGKKHHYFINKKKEIT